MFIHVRPEVQEAVDHLKAMCPCGDATAWSLGSARVLTSCPDKDCEVWWHDDILPGVSSWRVVQRQDSGGASSCRWIILACTYRVPGDSFCCCAHVRLVSNPHVEASQEPGRSCQPPTGGTQLAAEPHRRYLQVPQRGHLRRLRGVQNGVCQRAGCRYGLVRALSPAVCGGTSPASAGCCR